MADWLQEIPQGNRRRQTLQHVRHDRKPTLAIPSYVGVSNPANGKSVVVVSLTAALSRRPRHRPVVRRSVSAGLRRHRPHAGRGRGGSPRRCDADHLCAGWQGRLPPQARAVISTRRDRRLTLSLPPRSRPPAVTAAVEPLQRRVPPTLGRFASTTTPRVCALTSRVSSTR